MHRNFFLVCFALLYPMPLSAAPLDVAPEDLRPGLLAEYRSLVELAAGVTRVDAKPAFFVGMSSPHPRLPAGTFAVTWTGAVHIKEPGAIRFDAFVGGEMQLEVDGDTVLKGAGNDVYIKGAKSLERPAGLYRLKLTYRSQTGVPGRMQLWWEGATFSREPVPAWRFQHVVSERTPGARDEEKAAHGKKLAEQLGCARCHAGAMPGIAETPPGPALHDVRGRMGRDWLLRWLDAPAKVHADARMPGLFAGDRTGFVERWIVATHLVGEDAPKRTEPSANHRMGRQLFLSVGCVACHFIPDMLRGEQLDLERMPLRTLAERMTYEGLTSFLQNPHGRYPDERMPRLHLTPEQSADIAAYLLLWSPPAEEKKTEAPTPAEIDAIKKRLQAKDVAAAGAALLREKACVKCHVGLGPTEASSIPITNGNGCLTGEKGPRFVLEGKRETLAAYLHVAGRETHLAPFASRQRLLERAGCVRCHQRDSDKPSPLETASSSLGGAYLQYVPFQRTPRLTNAHQKFTSAHVVRALREGVSGLRVERFTFRMPAFGNHADTLAQALAEADGEAPATSEPASAPPLDPTAASLLGPQLVGFQGYACVSCHLWNGQKFGDPDPGAVATDLLRVPGRIHRDWFERFLEDPARFHPGTPMPGIFPKGKPALLASVLDGDAVKQKDALWHYFAMGPGAPSPKPPPPLPVEVPANGPLVAQIPLHMPDLSLVESVTLLTKENELVVYDLATGAIRNVLSSAGIQRHVQARLRKYVAEGTPNHLEVKTPVLKLTGGSEPEAPLLRTFLGYERLDNGMRLRWELKFASGIVQTQETIRIEKTPGPVQRHLVHEVEISNLPKDRKTLLQSLGKVAQGGKSVSVTFELLGSLPKVIQARFGFRDEQYIGGTRPGYVATPYRLPRTRSGEDAVVPVAVAVHPRDGRVFVASMKMGEIFVIREPMSKTPKLEDYANGLFQEAYGLLSEEDGLYVLHRRNLSKLVDKAGSVTRVDRVLSLPHGVGDTYDYGYGLVRDKTGAFVYTFAPHANRELVGSGSVLRHKPGEKPEEIGFGMRNPVGWIAGPEGEIFFTDNQGEWVATNKLCHVVKGRFYGYPNQAQKEHAKKPLSKATIWVPYDWARSINGAAYDNTQGKFGPFAGQVFLAELMYGGAIIRANLEKVNGEYQGACFPFWGKGLLGPVSLAFDPVRGPMYVGGITEPGWMAQPDRGALYRIDYTGDIPFEMQSIHVLPSGFKIVFTRPVDAKSAQAIASYQLEHYRYEYTGAYGSPELDRTQVPVKNIVVAPDGLSVSLTTPPLVRDRVYMIQTPGIRSPRGEPLVHPTGAYTLNEIPK